METELPETAPFYGDVHATPLMSEAGMLPKILCKLLDPIPMVLSRRRTNGIGGR